VSVPERLILVVEDDPDHALLVRRALERHAPPCRVTVVGRGAEALHALERERYAAVLLDYSLPEANGLEVLARIRAGHRGLPVVMVTGQGDERIAVQAMQAGATDYVLKTAGYIAALPTVLLKALKQHELSRENERLHAETARQLRDTEAVLAIAQVLNSTLEPWPLLHTVAREVARACRMDRCSIFFVDGDRVVPVTSQFADGREDPALATAFRALGRLRVSEIPLVVEMMRTAEPVAMPNVVGNPLVPREFDVFAPQHVLLVPLVRGSRVLGALVLDNGERGEPVTLGQISLGSAIAGEVALALENARLYREAQEALARLQATQEQLVQGATMRALGELASGAAHHLNNLLAIVLGRAELLLRDERSAPIRRPVEIIARAARDGAEVVRRIQQFARMRGTEVAEPVELNEVARTAVEMTRGLWQDAATARGIRIEVAPELGPLALVRGDASALREVVTNLLLNAVDALPEGGRITLRTWMDGSIVALAVADDGVGMSDEVLARAQDPFFTTKGLKATGLGLSVSYGIVSRHDGNVTIESAPGQGTTVTVRLPAAEGAAPVPVVSAPEPISAGLRVLVVDDEPDVGEVVAEMVAADGHQVAVVGGAAQALAWLERERADLVLTDFGMPGMTGADLARAIRERWPGVLLGLVTGWGVDAGVLARAGEVVDFTVGKPLELDEFRAALAKARADAPPAAAGSAER
jgi:signal transduction histidine kinase/DNA-binding response OmpR family regulator